MGRNFDHSAELNSSPGLMRRGFAGKKMIGLVRKYVCAPLSGAGQRQWVSRHTREMNEQALK